MCLKFSFLKIAAFTCSLFLLFGQNASAQKKVSESVLVTFEDRIAQGKTDEVETPLLAYAVAHPNDSKPLELLALLRLRQGRLNEAKGLYQRVLILAPNAVGAKINLGKVYILLGQKTEAQQVLKEVAADKIASPTIRQDLAAGLILVGETELALKILETLPPSLKSSDALPLFAAIDLATENRQRLASRVPLMKKLAANVNLTLRNAEILQSSGLLKEAAALLRSALAVTPTNPGLLVRLGRLEIYFQDFAQAQIYLNRAAALSPNSAEILSAQALFNSAQGNLAEAFDLLTKARQIAPDSAVVSKDYVVVAMRFGKPQVAVDEAKKLLKVVPDDSEAEYLLGAAQLQSNHISEAQATLEQFMQRHPKDSRGCLALGLTLAAQRDKFEDARRHLYHCLDFDPANYEVKYQIALSYKAQGDSAQGIRLLEEVVKVKPDYAAALRDLGTLYLQIGSEAKAQTVLEKSVSINPNDAETHFQLSRLYNLTGNSILAKQHLDTFQKIKKGGKTSP